MGMYTLKLSMKMRTILVSYRCQNEPMKTTTKMNLLKVYTTMVEATSLIQRIS